MKERPILFSTKMVQAILAGCKTQTRRIVKPQPPNGCEDKDPILDWCNYNNEKGYQNCYMSWETELHPDGFHNVVSPYGKVGDVLWVRESFLADMAGYSYKANQTEEQASYFKWKPSIHMPKDAARIWLRITNIRVEILQDIKPNDCRKEGYPNSGYAQDNWVKLWFENLWLSINGMQSWNDNPWVWVIEFERIEKPNL
jgi:hypothetical protein